MKKLISFLLGLTVVIAAMTFKHFSAVHHTQHPAKVFAKIN